jgi:hypothetical protein
MDCIAGLRNDWAGGLSTISCCDMQWGPSRNLLNKIPSCLLEMLLPFFGLEIHSATLSSDFTMVDGTVFTGAKGEQISINRKDIGLTP